MQKLVIAALVGSAQAPALAQTTIQPADDPHLWLEEADLFPLQRLPFEDGSFLAPRNPDRYLQLMYGDYMRLPPPDQREQHSTEILPTTPCPHPESRPWPPASRDADGAR